MKMSILKKSMLAVLVAASTIVPTASVMAQNANIGNWRSLRVAPRVNTPPPPRVIKYNSRIAFPNNPFVNYRYRRNVTITPSALAQARASRPPVVMTPGRGNIGTPIQVQINRNFGATPALLSFKAVVSRGVPARVHTRLSGGGSLYTTPVPIQLCIQGGGTWQAELVLSNGRNLGVVGSFTPANCP